MGGTSAQAAQGMAIFNDEGANNTTGATGGDDGEGFDVNKLDSSALQDVIQYAGIDLKAEQEMIARSYESASVTGGNVPMGRDPRMHHIYYFSPMRLKSLISAAVRPKGITDMSEDCLDMIALATTRRLANLLTELSAISKNRIDQGRSRFKIKIENDPKRQIWLVEQFLIAENERSQLRGSFGSGGDNMAMRAKLKKVEKRASEDVAVKTKLANITAAQAVGLQVKSWMTDPSTLAPHSQPADSSSSTLMDSDSNARMPLHFSQAPTMTPTTDRELLAQFANRTITLKDLVALAESDPHLRHSSILLSLYSQLS